VPRPRVDSSDFAAKLELDRLLLVELERAQRHPVFRRVSREIVLRAIGPVVGGGVVRGEERHLAGKPFPAQHLGGGKSGSPATHDHDAVRMRALTASLAGRRLSGGFDFFAHEHRAVALFHAPARHRIEGGRSERLAGAQAEAGMVPGTAHDIANDQSLSERAAVVRAGRANREQFIAATRQQHGLLAHMPAHHGAVAKISERNPAREIRSLRLGLLGSHNVLRAGLGICAP
jgi:hypothetical protein